MGAKSRYNHLKRLAEQIRRVIIRRAVCVWPNHMQGTNEQHATGLGAREQCGSLNGSALAQTPV